MESILLIVIVFLIVIIIYLLSNRKKNNATDFDKYVNNSAGLNKTIIQNPEKNIPDPRSVYYKIHEKEIEANRLTKDYSIKHLNIDDKTSVFYNKNVVITGTFSSYSRDNIAAYIHSNGGARRSTITSATDIVLIGSINPGPSKIVQIEKMIMSGNKLQVIQEDELNEIMKK